MKWIKFTERKCDMDLHEFKLKSLGVDIEKFGRIYSFIDFGNVNYWYERDERDADGNILPYSYKLAVDIKKLSEFLRIFSKHNRFYFGIDSKNKRSIKIISKARQYFDKTITKPIQKIKHYLDESELRITTRQINQDLQGNYIYLPKCNFDVEICIDAVRFLESFDTFCLFSGDADFVYLLEFLKRNNKNNILFSSGHVSYRLKRKADLFINAQTIKKDITFIKQKPRL